MQHISVLLNETVNGLDVKPGEIYVDGTLGLAGHACAIYLRADKACTIVGFDKDEVSLAEAGYRLESLGAKPVLINQAFSTIKASLHDVHIESADAILLDIGVSSVQLDTIGRGFSFLRDEPLLMTMESDSTRAKITASDLIRTLDVDQLTTIITNYGEERYAYRISQAIVQAREIKPITTTKELADVITQAVPAFYRFGKVHPATRTFQALRIAVNNELGELEQGLTDGYELLRSGGRLAVITFHSLEDRIVKNFFKDKASEGAVLVNKKPIVPTDEEISGNRRARSAKLRIIRKP